MSPYRSGFSDLIEKFISYRKAFGCWNESGYERSLRSFDHYCANHYPGQGLCQKMLDEWCAKHETETNWSCCTRTQVIREFIGYLRSRNMTDTAPPIPPKPEKRKYVPHAFSHDELSRFFHECDSIVPYNRRLDYILRKVTCPVFFRLLYSSGIRTTEARYLKREDVDLAHGVLNIRKSKGYDQHYVALHESMTDLLRKYDRTAELLQPSRTYFFESVKGNCYSKVWVSDNFSALWTKANGKKGRIVAYDLRHNYAEMNINSWQDDVFGIGDKLQYLSKSMGHRYTRSTLYYYSIVPRLADTIREKTETGFNGIIPDPEVAYEEE